MTGYAAPPCSPHSDRMHGGSVPDFGLGRLQWRSQFSSYKKYKFVSRFIDIFTPGFDRPEKALRLAIGRSHVVANQSSDCRYQANLITWSDPDLTDTLCPILFGLHHLQLLKKIFNLWSSKLCLPHASLQNENLADDTWSIWNVLRNRRQESRN